MGKKTGQDHAANVPTNIYFFGMIPFEKTMGT